MAVPDWFSTFEKEIPKISRSQISQFEVPDSYDRKAAVLILFGPHDDDADLLFIERAAHLFDHPGQPAFPGGHVEEIDNTLTETALREANEEIGLNPDSVRIISQLPQLWIPPSKVAVTPVIGWWEDPHEITQVDPNEVAGVHRIPVKDLINPNNRVTVTTKAGLLGPAFKVNEIIVWGFTGGIVSALLDFAGLAKEWDKSIEYVLENY